MNKLIIGGAGGAGCEALWLVQRINLAAGRELIDVVGWADDNPQLKGEIIEGIPVLGPTEQVCRDLRGAGYLFHCAVGSNRQRERVAALFEGAGFLARSLVDPSAIVAASARIGDGCYIGPLSVVAPHARVGRHVLINSHVGVGHHAHVGDFAQLCPGARVSGQVRLGAAAFIGSNGVLAPGITVGEGATVGAASLAARDVPPGATALGVPAKILAVPPKPA